MAGAQDEMDIFSIVSSELPNDKWAILATKLGLTIKEVSSLEKETNIYHWGDDYKIIQMLEKWKQKENPRDQLVPKLVAALRSIGLNAIAHRIGGNSSADPPSSTSSVSQGSSSTGGNQKLTEDDIGTISDGIPRNKHRDLARKLGLKDKKIQEVETFCSREQLGDSEVARQFLTEWVDNEGKSATRRRMADILISIGRRALAEDVFDFL